MPKKKAVINLETKERFESTKEAAESVGIAPSAMSNHLRGRSATAGGQRFQYERVLEMERQRRENNGFVYLPEK